MVLFYLVLFICAFSNVICNPCDCKDWNFCKKSTGLVLEVYGAYLIGFTMLIMLLIIIGLSIALYMLKNNKTIFGTSLTKHSAYVRQESTQGVTLGNFTTTNTAKDMNRNDGSTLTVNSGIVELGGLGEPETPTPTHKEFREENKTPCIIKPRVPAMPYFHKEQIDSLMKEVLLNKRQKSESAILNELDVIAHEDKGECFYANAPEIHTMRNKFMTESKNEERKIPLPLDKKSPKLELKNNPKSVGQSVVDGREKFETKLSVDDEQEVYDTLPSPVKCITSDANDGDINDIPVYDLPPTRNWKIGENSNVVMDTDTDYMLLLSKNLTKDEEKACYINAKCQ